MIGDCYPAAMRRQCGTKVIHREMRQSNPMLHNIILTPRSDKPDERAQPPSQTRHNLDDVLEMIAARLTAIDSLS
ncbi:hypothetical protein A5765_20670 [Mycolicibacterium celeriflavum]|nr:hypothetical protein A5765_20670 [Mycolicibacterium celeriflavum]